MYVKYVTNQLEFLPALTGFCLLKWLDRMFHTLRFYFFLQAWLTRIFSLGGFIFPQSQPDPLIVGVSYIGHGYYGPETGDRVQKSNP